MEHEPSIHKPWLVAVWPGMGNVGVSAGYYLMAKLGMRFLSEFAAEQLFDADHVEVEGGLIHPGRLPRSRLFLWADPLGKHDIIVFLGEAQVPTGKQEFCEQIMDRAQALGIERVFTFAAMATEMSPDRPPRVFGAATDQDSLDELKRLELTILEDGQISGLNGVLLGAAAKRGLPGACLLGEMPHLFLQFLYPRASLAVLEAFTTIAGVEMDLTELRQQAEVVDQTLQGLMARMRRTTGEEEEPAVPEAPFDAETSSEPARPPAPEEVQLDHVDQARIEQLFENAARDRSAAYELKRELDRLQVFPRYEDRFLDLFRESE